MINKHLAGRHDQKLHAARTYRPDGLRASRQLVGKYHTNPGMKNPNFVMNDGFNAAMVSRSVEYITTIFDVTDPVVAEKFVDDVISAAKQSDFAVAVFTGLSLDTAIKHNGYYLLNNAGLALFTANAFEYLKTHYNIAIPNDKRTNLLLDWLAPQLPSIKIKSNEIYSYHIPVVELHNIKHPSQPDLPLFDEYMYTENAVKDIVIDL